MDREKRDEIHTPGNNGEPLSVGYQNFSWNGRSLFRKTGTEALLTGRFERTGTGRNLRIKVSVGHALVQVFGAAQWRIVFGVEMFGHK